MTRAQSIAFFKRHAGFSYDPKKETAAHGRERCARALVRAEERGHAASLSFDWQTDPFTDSSDFNDEQPAWTLWECICRNEAGKVVASLHGIDFGRDGQPWGDSYRRVVEAELAQEALS